MTRQFGCLYLERVFKPRRDPLVTPALAGTQKAAVESLCSAIAGDLILSVPFATTPVLGDLPLALYGPVMVCVPVFSPSSSRFLPLHMFNLGHRYLLLSSVEDEKAHGRLMPDSRF